MGFDPDEEGFLVPVPEELAVMGRMLRLRNGGGSLRGVAHGLNEEGLAAKGGGVWHPQGVKNILKRMADDEDLAATCLQELEKEG